MGCASSIPLDQHHPTLSMLNPKDPRVTPVSKPSNPSHVGNNVVQANAARVQKETHVHENSPRCRTRQKEGYG